MKSQVRNVVRTINDILGAVTYTDSATVTSVQKALKARGFDPGKIDGVMGPNTEQAITAFQAANGLPPSGVIDSTVLMSLAVLPPVEQKVKKPASTEPAPLVVVPSVPAQHGFFSQPVPVPGLGDRPLWQVLLGVKGVMLVVGGVMWLALRKKK
jgi:peptidoglycan hydrolase-like protein with peptidoglycan-binding domain